MVDSICPEGKAPMTDQLLRISPVPKMDQDVRFRMQRKGWSESVQAKVMRRLILQRLKELDGKTRRPT
jgi:hypothetical protein